MIVGLSGTDRGFSSCRLGPVVSTMARCEKRISAGDEESTSTNLLSGVPIQSVYVAGTRVRPMI